MGSSRLRNSRASRDRPVYAIYVNRFCVEDVGLAVDVVVENVTRLLYLNVVAELAATLDYASPNRAT